jgi:uncharacterized membrane protein
MSLSKNALNTLIAGAFTVAFAEEGMAAKEKCYGVVDSKMKCDTY